MLRKRQEHVSIKKQRTQTKIPSFLPNFLQFCLYKCCRDVVWANKHIFSGTHILHKIFNWNKVQISIKGKNQVNNKVYKFHVALPWLKMSSLDFGWRPMEEIPTWPHKTIQIQKAFTLLYTFNLCVESGKEFEGNN